MAVDPNQIISELVDSWCDRRELRPLSLVLPAWVGNNGLTDGWSQLHDDLKHAYVIYTELPAIERNKIKQAFVAIDYFLQNR